MKNVKETIEITNRSNYHDHFWNYMKGTGALSTGLAETTDGYLFPKNTEESLRNGIEKQSTIRSLATNLKKYTGDAKILAHNSDDYVAIVSENGSIPAFDIKDDLTSFVINSYKLAGLFKVNESFALDSEFDLEAYLRKRVSKSFGKTEDKVFLEGSGVDEPFGLLHSEAGAETGVTTASLTYDDCIGLFFSVKPEYRSNAVWVMNDKTALALRKLKDRDGNYLWNTTNDTILGRPVHICNEMPDIAVGKKPVLFGDFDYFWIIDRSPAFIKKLSELFIGDNLIGYLVSEFLDARLVRREAIKAIAVVEEENL